MASRIADAGRFPQEAAGGNAPVRRFGIPSRSGAGAEALRRMPGWIEDLVLEWLDDQDPEDLLDLIESGRSIVEALEEEYGNAIYDAPDYLTNREVGLLGQLRPRDFDAFLDRLLYECGDQAEILWRRRDWYQTQMVLLQRHLTGG